MDKIAAGEERYIDVVTRINNTLDNELGKMPPPEGVEQHECPECGKPLRLRNGKRGAFWGCTGDPDCNYLVDDNQGVPALPDKIYPCPECSKPMRRINGRKGPFWSCSGYPACRHAVNDLNGTPEGIVAAQVKNQQKTA